MRRQRALERGGDNVHTLFAKPNPANLAGDLENDPGVMSSGGIRGTVKLS
jgi:hypothetical protein